MLNGMMHLQLVNHSWNQNSWIHIYGRKIIFSAARALQDLPPNKCAAIAGKLADAETLVTLKDLINRYNSEQHFPKEGSGVNIRCNYLLNNKIANAKEAYVLLLIGTNPRYEAPVLNIRIRKGYLHGEQTIGLIASKVNLNYGYEVLTITLIDLSFI